MPTTNVPIADVELPRLSSVAERRGVAVTPYLGSKAARLSADVSGAKSQAEIEAELRARLAAIPIAEWDARDPELDELSGILPANFPEDYRELLLDKYR